MYVSLFPVTAVGTEDVEFKVPFAENQELSKAISLILEQVRL